MKFGADQKPRDSGGEKYSFSDCEAIVYLYNAQAPQPRGIIKNTSSGLVFLFLASYFFCFVEMDTSGKFPELVDHESCSSEYEWA